jgi:hypothetical protein
MNKRLVISAIFAAAALSGCVSYDYVGRSAPGGYYHGRPSVEYYSPYGQPGYGYPYSGGVSVYGGYGSGGYYGYPYYGHYGSYYPYYRPNYYYSPRPPRPDHNHPRPPKPPGNRPPPWRDPTNGAYRESGQVLVPPRSQHQPQYQRPTRPAPSSSQIRGDNPPRITPRQEPRNEVTRPRSVERPTQPAVRSAPRRTLER